MSVRVKVSTHVNDRLLYAVEFVIELKRDHQIDGRRVEGRVLKVDGHLKGWTNTLNLRGGR